MQRGLARVVLSALLFGASTPFAAIFAERLNPFTLAGLLYLGAAAAVAPSVLHRPPSMDSLRRGAKRLAVAVVVGGAVGPVLLALGLRYTTAAQASLLLTLELVLTVLLAATVFHEHLGRRVGVGTVLVTVGALVMVGVGSTAELRIGALLIAAACLAWAVDNSVTAELDELAPAHLTAAKGVLAGGVNLTIGLLAAPAPGAAEVGWVLLVGALGYGVSITLWVAGARDLGAARAQVVFSLAPFLGAAVAWLVLGEQITAATLAGAGLAAVGVSLVARSSHTHTHRHPAVVHDHEHTHDDGHHDHSHDDGFRGRHQHPHEHEVVVHAHPHVPDLHHRHDH